MIGIDVVDVERLRQALQRSPDLSGKLFTEEEQRYCSAHTDPAIHLAGTLAAKEAVMKALGVGSLGAWAKRIEITREPNGSPRARLDRGPASFGLSITHDAGVAIAAAISQSERAVHPVERAGGPPVSRYVLED